MEKMKKEKRVNLLRKKVTIDEMIGTIKTREETDSVKMVRSIYQE